MIGGSFLKRAALGGAAGYALGGWGGAAGGAAAAGFGWGGMKNMSNKYGAAGRLGKGLGYASEGASFLAGKGLAASFTRGGSDFARGMRAGGEYLRQGAVGARTGINTASSFIGRNAATTNKIAGYGMAAMGVGTSAYIGSSIMSSNRGY